jgi:AraC family transcriptional regulator
MNSKKKVRSPARLIHFASKKDDPTVAYIKRLRLGDITLAECVLAPNAGFAIGAKEATFVLHLGEPLALDWRPPGSDKMRHRRILPGNAHVHGANAPFWQRWLEPASILVVAIEPGFLSRPLSGPIAQNARIATEIGVDDPILRQFGALFEHALKDGGSAGRAYAESLAAALVIHLAHRATPGSRDNPPVRGGLAPAILRRVIDYIHANLAKDLGLAELADLAGLNPYHFAHAFKAATGMPPHRYIIGLRVHRARELLIDRRLSIADVALAVGFSSQSHFTLNFRRITGTTPARYRERR